MSEASATTPMRLLAYGSFGLPLAFAALPIYVVLPDWYAQRFDIQLAMLGGLLLAARLLDALVDPLIGRWLDGRAARCKPAILLAIPLLACGFAALFHPQASSGSGLILWLLLSLLLTYAGFSLGSIAYQTWGARLACSARGRARVSASREGCGLLGVLLAVLIPQWLGMSAASLLLAALLLVSGALLLRLTPAGEYIPSDANAPPASWLAPLADPAFRALLAVFLLNGIASAIPATLVLFFVRDALGLEPWSGLFLGAYFLAGVAVMPLWVRLAGRIGLLRSWLAGMALAVFAFIWVLALPGLDSHLALPAFLLLSLLSGMALGADLVVPAALLAGLLQREGAQPLGQGASFGLWNMASKLNLALAAGLALPLLGWLGYVPSRGAQAASGTLALVLAYGLLPCLLKLAAAALLWRIRARLAGERDA